MKKTLWILCLISLLSPLVLTAQVTVKEIQMEIPTYVTGPDDPAPPFGLPNIYPYPLQTDITRTKVLQKHRVVVLENEYIRVLILPDIGGRILAAIDKTNRDFDFIYYNHVIKPGLVSLRGAWLSGGIEWNFPTLGHTVNTVSPVKYQIQKRADGSAACLVGTEEWVRRMKWEVFITLYPGRSYFTTRIILENRALTHNNGYFWANAATHDWDDTRVIFPPTNYTYAGGRANPTPWPLFEGRDVSWVKNTANPYDYFCGTPGDFNAAYNYARDNGTAHYADRYDSPGKKFWTWGTAPSGMIWEDLLTDENGQYIEVQSGRLLTQGDTWIFDPLHREDWTEWWFPLKKMGGLVKATPDAAVNLEVRDKGVFVALNVTGEVKGAELKITRDGESVFSEKVNLTPAGYYRKEIPLAKKDGPFKLSLADSAGRTIIEYSTEKPVIPPPELQPVISDAGAVTAEAKYLQGYYALKHWDAESAKGFFKKALEMDPNFSPALRWLGILYYKTGKTREALDLFTRCLGRDEDDHVARYYRGLAKKRLGLSERTEEDLAMASRRAAGNPGATYALAALQSSRKDYTQAFGTLQGVQSSSSKARVMLSALARHDGDAVQAEQVAAGALTLDPIDSLAVLESYLVKGSGDLTVLRNDPEYFLEAAADYADFGLYDDAARVIEVYLNDPVARPYPMLYYDRGYYCEKQGLMDEAKKHYIQAAACSLDYAFPFRTESEDVLRAALGFNPADWKARYLLGNLLTAELRWEEGLAEFQKAAEAGPRFAMLYRNLGELYLKRAGRVPDAVTMYERAVALDKNNYHLYGMLDELYARSGDNAARDRLFRQAPESVQKNFNTVLKRAQFFVETGEQARALQLFRSNTFLPWEGWTNAHQVYVLANVKEALDLIGRKAYGPAASYLLAAKDYPKNLGTGRPASPVFSLQDYYLGLCSQSMGRKSEAVKFFQDTIKYGATGSPEAVYYQALALKQTGHEAEAKALLERMRNEAEGALDKEETAPGFYQVALACRGLGDGVPAAKYFESAVKLDPSLRWTSLFLDEQKIAKK
jgi:tetratricopeptide (TPR) repeat protein